MAVNADVKLTNEKGYYDISFENGDFKKEQGFDTAILMSLTCERRADPSEVIRPEFRRGWVGNEINGYLNFEYGSKNWLLEQARANQLTLKRAETYNQDCVQWFVDGNLVDSITVTTSYDQRKALIINIDFFRNGSKILTRAWNLWENTFVNGTF